MTSWVSRVLGSGRDGVDAAIEIRRRFGIASLFMSANQDPHTVARAEAADPVGWLPKPYAIETLLAAVEAALDTDAPMPTRAE